MSRFEDGYMVSERVNWWDGVVITRAGEGGGVMVEGQRLCNLEDGVRCARRAAWREGDLLGNCAGTA